MSEWREPTEAEVEDAMRRHPQLGRERAARLARAEAWQADRGIATAKESPTRAKSEMRDKMGRATEKGRETDFEQDTRARSDFFARLNARAPDGVTYGKGKAND